MRNQLKSPVLIVRVLFVLVIFMRLGRMLGIVQRAVRGLLRSDGNGRGGNRPRGRTLVWWGRTVFLLCGVLLMGCDELLFPDGMGGGQVAASIQATPTALAAIVTVPAEQPIDLSSLPPDEGRVRTEISATDGEGRVLWRTFFRCGERWELVYESPEFVTFAVYGWYIEPVHSWLDGDGMMHSVALYREHLVGFDCLE